MKTPLQIFAVRVLISLTTLPLFSNVCADLPSAGFNYAKASAAYIDQSTASTLDKIYFGGSFGASEAENYCSVTSGCENKDSAWKGFVGYKINERFSAEAAYTSIGDLHKKGTTSDVSAFSVAGVANIPINDQFGVFGKAGFAHWKSANTDSEKSGSGLTYGVGAKVSLSETMKLRAEWERLPSISTSNTEESDIDMMSIGIELSTL
ncbi:MAG: porin family protein [Cocleimonas sp.]|nr:porin family protein [Cocleimonas sp.]